MMTTSIRCVPSFIPITQAASWLNTLQDSVSKLFAKVKSAWTPSTPNDTQGISGRQIFNFQALRNQPEAKIEGAIWGGFFALSLYFAVDSLYDLRRAFHVEYAANEKFEKIGSAVKNAFVDLLTLGGSVAYLGRWADEAKVIFLGRYLLPLSYCCFGVSIVINAVEAGADLYNILDKREAIKQEISPAHQTMHRHWLRYASLKLVGNISMVAWGILSAAALAGAAISAQLITTLLVVGFTAAVVAYSYKQFLETLQKNQGIQANLAFSRA